ncbi:LysR family transcriptional regulator [Brochothrix campestris]|uniref:LysR family transcriptional regulator n=1 Tax=Brochothrix campestris FSL F6-1037 TaxID=1265861 RepID=W7D1B2_9LIST|nr:LysR family transcriptional regulator [Brochothrix campestris]EUJ39098.1 LysR family transcriptional regulator [Brochothrix campestris FSL F6-1037]
MSITEFRILDMLAEELNMRKTAERLYISQPALSQRLQSIEARWGKQLFIRTRKGLLLTPQGELIVEFARSVINREENVFDKLLAMEGVVQGTLKIYSGTIVAQRWLPFVFKEFVKRYPHVNIELDSGGSRRAQQAIADGKVHLAITRGETDWLGEKRYLFGDNLSLADKYHTSIEDILASERPFIRFKTDSDYDQSIMDYWQQYFHRLPEKTLVVDQIETCKQMAMSGMGYTILPLLTIDKHTDLNLMPLIQEDGTQLHRDTWLLGYKKSFQLPQVQAFVQLIEELDKEKGLLQIF